MAGWVTLLGFSAEANGAALLAAMGAVPGPKMSLFHAGGLAALAQAETGRLAAGFGGAGGALQRLRVVQLRLEAACLLGPFLPADPAHARCARKTLAGLLDAASPAIRAALADAGTRHQWDVVLRWQPEAVVASRRAEIAEAASGAGRAALADAVASALARERTRREAALRAAVGSAALDMTPAGAGPTETGITALLQAGGEAVLEAALERLPADVSAGATIDMRGPLPPLSFSAVRIDRAAPSEVAAAWRALALPAQVDAAGLRRHWRDCAARLHPDRGVADDGPISAAGAAFRLLRDLLPAEDGEKPWSLVALQRHAACRMSVRAAAPEMAP